MEGVDLEVLEEAAKKLGLPFAEVRECFEALEAEGKVFQAKDEISGKTLWFPVQVLDTEANA